MTIRIAIQDQHNGLEEEAYFERSPIRIGRNALNDLLIEDPAVSQWHAQIVFDGERAWLIDMGSSNGTLVDGQAVHAHEAVPIEPRNVVEIGSAHVRCERSDQPAACRAGSLGTVSPEVLTALTRIDVALEPEEAGEEEPHRANDGSPATAIASSAIVQLQYLRATMAALEPSRAAYLDAVREQIAALPEHIRAKLIPQLAREHPELSRSAAFKEIASAYGVSVESGDSSASEWVARMTGAPLLGPNGEDVSDARVLARAAALLQTFAHCLFELRRVKQQTTRELGLGEPSEAQPRSGQDILAYLLDFRVDGEERAQALVREFAELAIHQLAVMSAIRAGVRALLAELAPGHIEQRERQARARSGALLDLVPLTGLQLWSAYRRVHGDLIEGDRFARSLFGGSFATAYLSSVGSAAARPAIPPPALPASIPATR